MGNIHYDRHLQKKNKTPLVVPRAVRRQNGQFKNGQEIEFKVSRGMISIRPKLPCDDDEYTPEQRRVIDAQLAEGVADIKAGNEPLAPSMVPTR